MPTNSLRRPRTPDNQPFQLRHPGHPLGSDYDVDTNTGCWLWKWGTGKDGYANARSQGRTFRIARFLANTPAGMDTRHNPGCPRHCINPFHLQVGTRSENVRDMHKDGNGNRKLSDKQAEVIRRRAWAGENQTQIGREFGVSRETVSHIKHGRNYTYKLSTHRR